MQHGTIVKAVNPEKNCLNCDNCERVISVADYACSYWSELLWHPETQTCHLMDNSLNPDWQILFDEIYESQLINPAQATTTPTT